MRQVLSGEAAAKLLVAFVESSTSAISMTSMAEANTTVIFTTNTSPDGDTSLRS